MLLRPEAAGGAIEERSATPTQLVVRDERHEEPLPRRLPSSAERRAAAGSPASAAAGSTRAGSAARSTTRGTRELEVATLVGGPERGALRVGHAREHRQRDVLEPLAVERRQDLQPLTVERLGAGEVEVLGHEPGVLAPELHAAERPLRHLDKLVHLDGFMRKSAQPAFIACTASRTSSRPVTATASRSGARRLASRTSATPSMPGITMSVTNGSGLARRGAQRLVGGGCGARVACPAAASASRKSSW